MRCNEMHVLIMNYWILLVLIVITCHYNMTQHAALSQHVRFEIGLSYDIPIHVTNVDNL